MAVAQKEIQTTDTIKLELMQDNNTTVFDESALKYRMYSELMKVLYSEEAKSNILFTKVNNMDDDLINLKARVEELEQNQVLLKETGFKSLHAYTEARRKPNVKRVDRFDSKSSLQECKQIIDRINEILAEWCETKDIKTQIQYAAIIVTKIENMKKKEFIQTDGIRRKICTLLRNVIRLNATENILTREQILLLKKGLLLLFSDKVQKKDMLQLNREFWSEHLMTMPAWE